MGNCVPAQKSTEPAMDLRSSIHTEENKVQIESPIKENKVNGDLSMSELNSKLQSSSPSPYESSFRGSSNRVEMFFDSEPWIDSDIEDFLSVNGDFTPLGGTTPLHQSSYTKNPQCDESIYISSNANSLPESSPTDMKKQLIEYFRESFSSDVNDNQELQDKTETKPISFYLPSKCRNRNAYESVNSSICSSETTPNGYLNRTKGKPAESEPQCCFPNLVRSFSFSERKKRLSSAYNGCK